MSDILNNETKIIYETENHVQINYETFIEHIKNNILMISINADKRLTIYITHDNITNIIYI